MKNQKTKKNKTEYKIIINYNENGPSIEEILLKIFKKDLIKNEKTLYQIILKKLMKNLKKQVNKLSKKIQFRTMYFK